MIGMVLTRSIRDARAFGRVKTLQSISSALSGVGTIEEFVVRTILEERRVGSLVRAGWRFLWGLLTGRAVALQVLLYGSFAADRAVPAIAKCPTIYLDSVRTLGILCSLRRLAPQSRYVVDFDDLMSRRMQLLLEGRLPLSLGFLKGALPRFLARAIEGASCAHGPAVRGARAAFG